jgi:hypothetical protein
MMRKLRLVIPLLAIALSFATNAAAQNGPYYATPSWDQKIQCDTSATCPRFIVLANWNNEAVLDRETGLVWEKSPTGPPASPGSAPWDAALFSCLHNKVVGNRLGWRLPTIQELASLIDPSVAAPGPTLPAGHPFVLLGAVYWSATTVVDDANSAYSAAFNGSNHVDFGPKFGALFVWCVRGGQGLDAQ